MKDFISFFFKGFFLFFTDSNFRVFLRLFFINAFKKGYTEYNVSFNGLKIRTADMKSFVWQFYEIFFRNFYTFNTSAKHPVIYDCGSNIGTSVLFFSLKYPLAKIVAFEASPYIFGILESNIKNNNVTNATLHQNAVWIRNEIIEFSDEGADSGSVYSISDAKKIKVQAVDFLEIIKKEDRIDFLKIDIEGAENDLLPHIASQLDKIENIFIEYHSFNNMEQNLDAILMILKQNHFRYYIQHVNDRKKPFIDTQKNKDMDMMLNIFAYKNQ